MEGASLALGHLPRLAVVLGLVLLLPLVLSARPSSAGVLLLGIAAATAAGGALGRVAGLFQLAAGVRVVWGSAASLRPAARSGEAPGPGAVLPAAPAAPGETLVDASELRFQHEGRGEQVLEGLTLRIRAGERLLLEGPSGSGKSTLVAVLAGLREPTGGGLLLRGIDRHTLTAEEWRRVVAMAPQFHENHVFSATFAFNLLLGRRWPPSASDLTEATRLCEDLGLGPLLGRMPAGIHQHLGETGWQLSHGEKSRLFLARALLQEPDLVIFDESFAALDPATLGRVLRVVEERARTLLVVAHP
jgi:ATP-binding cassette subfamily B protein